jgi:hypothetical protein
MTDDDYDSWCGRKAAETPDNNEMPHEVRVRQMARPSQLIPVLARRRPLRQVLSCCIIQSG